MRFLFALLLTVTAVNPMPVLADQYVSYGTEESFEDVMDNVKMAIENRGMYINNVMHMSEMLERTGKDLGFEKRIYLKADSIEFCSALLSRRMTEEDPRRIINCPFIISIYVLPVEPGKTYIAHRRLAGDDASGVMKEVMDMLREVASAGVEGW
jgi:uncharacterized protein (DUF302 family)